MYLSIFEPMACPDLKMVSVSDMSLAYGLLFMILFVNFFQNILFPEILILNGASYGSCNFTTNLVTPQRMQLRKIKPTFARSI
jgi:hypothetical protein